MTSDIKCVCKTVLKGKPYPEWIVCPKCGAKFMAEKADKNANGGA